MRVGLDGTPLLGRPTGVGTYVGRLIPALLDRTDPPELTVTAVSLRGFRDLRTHVSAGVRVAGRPAPAGLLHRVWARSEFGPAELLTGRVDVFHATNFVLPPLRRARGVVTVHDLAFLRHVDTVSAASLRYRELVPRSVARASVVCALSEAMRAELVAEYAVASDRVVVTPMGVDDAWFAAAPDDGLRARLGLPERYVVAVGTLEPRKNLAVLVEAARRWRSADPDAPSLVLVGPSGWGDRLDVSDLPAGAVIFTGYLEIDDLRAVVAGAGALAFPSRHEGFGIPPVEALACGVPVVASDLAVTREVLGDEAIFADPADADAWAVTLARAVGAPRDPAADDRRRDRARLWTWSRCAEATLAAYRRAAAG